MKKLIIFSLMLFLISGCSVDTNSKNEGGLDLAKEYMELHYNVNIENLEDYPFYSDNPANWKTIENEAKKYLTEDAYQRLFANRVNSSVVYTATETNRNITLEDIKFEFYQHNESTGYDYYNYTAKLRFESPDGVMVDTLEQKGQIALTNENGEWRIANVHNSHLLPDDINFD